MRCGRRRRQSFRGCGRAAGAAARLWTSGRFSLWKLEVGELVVRDVGEVEVVDVDEVVLFVCGVRVFRCARVTL